MPKPTTVDLWITAARLKFELAGPPVVSRTSLLCPVVFDGRAAFVKITDDPDELIGALALETWAGHGAVRVLARAGNAVVLERAGPTLRSVLSDDTAATEVVCAVARRLHSSTPDDVPGFPTVRRWFSSLFADADPRFDEVRTLADRLLRRRSQPVLLHGDLHHDNVLHSARGWLAIDPKGLVGPREFDYCTLFTNPTPQAAVDHFDARVRVVAETADIESVDLLRWIACWGALSGIWYLEDGDRDNASLPHAVSGLAMARLRNHRAESHSR